MPQNDYARYKFASEATGRGVFPDVDVEQSFPSPTGVINENKHSVSLLGKIVYLNPASVMYISTSGVRNKSTSRDLLATYESLLAKTPTISSSYPDNLAETLFIETVTKGGTVVTHLGKLRKAKPIFKKSTETKFAILVNEWRATRNSLSSGIEMFTNPAYQQIIGMGQEVVPLILRELERDVDHWFWALKAITGTDPAPPSSRGRLRLMASAWFIWARKQGYEW